MAVLPTPRWSYEGQEQWRQPCSSTSHALADVMSDQADKHQDTQPKREGCCHPHLSEVFFKAGWKYMPRASSSQTQVPSSMAILTRFDSQKRNFKKTPKRRDCDAITEFEPQLLAIRATLQGNCSQWGTSTEEVMLQPQPCWSRLRGDPVTCVYCILSVSIMSSILWRMLMPYCIKSMVCHEPAKVIMEITPHLKMSWNT